MPDQIPPETPALSRERRSELLARAEAAELIELADEVLATAPDPVVLVAPEIGSVAAQVREPIVGQRFLLGEVLVCRAEVELDGRRGWAMRLDEDLPAVLAAAILDAAAQREPADCDRVDRLCRRVAERIRAQEAAEWAELEPTIVSFEELR